MEPPTEVFDRGVVAEQIKLLYTTHIRARGGRWARWRPGAANPSIWLSAADVCLNNGLDTRSHVVALLSDIRKPFPSMLIGQRAIARTRKYAEGEARDERTGVLSQLAFMRGRMRMEESVEYILNNLVYSLSPAFRHYAAAAVGLGAVSNRFEESANLELRLHPTRKLELEKVFRGATDVDNS